MFQYINPVYIRNVWQQVKVGLIAVQRKTGEQWLIEDVYAALKTGSAQLFTFPDGFVVLQSLRDQWTNEPCLHIWITHHAGHDDLTEDFISNLRKLADNAGVKKVTFTSPRRWDRRSGATLKSYNYELEV